MIGSIYKNEQDLLKSIIEVHLKGVNIHIDPMYFKGNFYKNGIAKPFHRFDINPIGDCSKGDARDLPIDNEYANSIILDPPFMFGIHGKSKKYYSSATHGIFKSFYELEELYRGILKEAYRILKNKGILIFKCQDYTDSKTTMVHCFVYNWALEQGFYAKDLAILNLPKNKIYNSNLKQKHFRKVHSYFWIFEKRGGKTR